METCVHLFKSHPNLSNIKFVVVPILREVLESSSDIAMDMEEMMERFSSGTEGIRFDFSYLMLQGAPELWQVGTLTSVQKQAEVMQDIASGAPV